MGPFGCPLTPSPALGQGEGENEGKEWKRQGMTEGLWHPEG